MSVWKSIQDHKPTEEGIYVVAKFEGDKMVEYSTAWCLAEGYWGPNSASYWGARDMTHWMTAKEYRQALAALPRE